MAFRNLRMVQDHLKGHSGDTFAAVLQSYVRSNSNHLSDPERLSGYIRARDWGRLVDWAELGPVEHGSVESYFTTAQFVALIRKYPFTRTETPRLDPEGAALGKFLASEHRCKRVNQRFRAKRRSVDRYSEILHVARRWIEWVIGPEPLTGDWYPLCDFGPGAALGVHGDATSYARKLCARKWSVSVSARPYALGAMWSNFHIAEWVLSKDGDLFSMDPARFGEYVSNRLRLTESSSITFVPKSAKTHRAIAVEPLLNGFLQKGAGELIARRLRRVGIDLRDQGRNQALARKASVERSCTYVTLDLSAASDSLAIEVVRDLLPPAWFELLMELRVPRTRLPDGREIVLQKISSMGNGFTFPLETLVFSSICHAAAVCCRTKPDFSVYGDDIIVQQEIALLVVELLAHLGFAVNREKSFFFGSFRESCGADWLGGVDVRPVIADNRLETLSAIFALHNGMRRNAACKATLAECQTSLREAVPADWRFSRPVLGELDTAFEVDDVCPDATAWCPDTQRFAWRELSKRAVRDFDTGWRGSATLLMTAALRGGSPEMPYTYRRRTVVFVVQTTEATHPPKRVLRQLEKAWEGQERPKPLKRLTRIEVTALRRVGLIQKLACLLNRRLARLEAASLG